jgi:V-type H+-transporting ATPase subunit C
LEISFVELFIALMHLKIMRAYVDSVLRFGIPPKFVLGIYKPVKGKEKQILTSMQNEFGDEKMKFAYGSKEDTGDNEDYYPFVQISLTSPLELM